MDFFIPFKGYTKGIPIPKTLNDPFDYSPDTLSLMATNEVQDHLMNQKKWIHNFGLNSSASGKPIGKMFGVLVVQNRDDQLGYLSAFSGKLAGGNHHARFVPPVYDSLAEGTFLTPGMLQLKQINNEIKELTFSGCKSTHQLMLLKEKRKSLSQQLQSKLFDSYKFLNTKGHTKTPRELFVNPPAGAGECAAPKLLQYAFQHHLRPVSMAEFWWGIPPSHNSIERIHKHFYPACKDKCEVILKWMLS